MTTRILTLGTMRDRVATKLLRIQIDVGCLGIVAALLVSGCTVNLNRDAPPNTSVNTPSAADAGWCSIARSDANRKPPAEIDRSEMPECPNTTGNADTN